MRETIHAFIKNNSGALCFLSYHKQLLHDILPIISNATIIVRSGLLVKALAEGTSVARVLRTICTPEPEAIFVRTKWCKDEEHVFKVMLGLKHLGFSCDGKVAPDLALELGGPVTKYL